MAFIKTKQEQEIVPDVKMQLAERPDAKSIIVDTDYTPVSHLLTHVEGAKWTVDYFSQILNIDSAVAGHNPTKSNLYQQYECIHGYVLKVSVALGTSQDDETKVMRVQGTATCYPPLVPNVGDMFLADIGDGKTGIFRVENSEKKSFLKDAVYEITYHLVNYAQGYELNDLMNKVIRHLYFWQDFLDYGQDPMLTEEDYHFVRDINREYRFIASRYIERYLSDRYKCFLLPHQDLTTYDYFMNKAISQWLSDRDNIKMRYLNLYNVSDEPSFQSFSIFDVINAREVVALNDCFKEVFKVSTSVFHKLPRIQSLRYSGLKEAILPRNIEYTVDDDYLCNGEGKILHNHLVSFKSGNFKHRESNPITYLDNIPMIHPINLNQSYIFSSSFYNNDDEGLSHLEILLLSYLEKRALNIRTLSQLIKDWHNWDVMEQFYYTPFVLVLLKAAVRGM